MRSEQYNRGMNRPYWMTRAPRFALLPILLAAASACGPPSPPPTSRPAVTENAPRVLVFTKTAEFRHESIPDGIKAVTEMGAKNGFAVDATEDAAAFNDTNLARYKVVIFLSTTGDILDARQQDAFESYVQHGGGFVGVHAATDTEYDWAWYTKLVGAQFASHPKIQEAVIDVSDRDHISTKHLPAQWKRTDEWYNFRDHPTDKAGGTLRILATLDESTYEGGSMPASHPVVWCQEFDGGRAWYTALGHTKESYAEENFLKMLLGGIQWAGGL